MKQQKQQTPSDDVQSSGFESEEDIQRAIEKHKRRLAEDLESESAYRSGDAFYDDDSDYGDDENFREEIDDSDYGFEIETSTQDPADAFVMLTAPTGNYIIQQEIDINNFMNVEENLEQIERFGLNPIRAAIDIGIYSLSKFIEPDEHKFKFINGACKTMALKFFHQLETRRQFKNSIEIVSQLTEINPKFENLIRRSPTIQKVLRASRTQRFLLTPHPDYQTFLEINKEYFEFDVTSDTLVNNVKWKTSNQTSAAIKNMTAKTLETFLQQPTTGFDYHPQSPKDPPPEETFEHNVYTKRKPNMEDVLTAIVLHQFALTGKVSLSRPIKEHFVKSPDFNFEWRFLNKLKISSIDHESMNKYFDELRQCVGKFKHLRKIFD